LILHVKDRQLSLDHVAVMGVLNVTPDSFSDGGLWIDPSAAVKHAHQMIAEGAAIIDIGGESTRPGAVDVPEDEELRRVMPVIERLSAESDVPISIDTRKASVARKAVAAGASIINDTSGEVSDKSIDAIALDTGAAIVIMHSRGTPETMRSLVEYGDVVNDVRSFLSARGDELTQRGVDPARVVLDPGFGFAKNPGQNLVMLQRLDEISSLPFPILSGTSRKSFIGAVLDVPEDQRLEGSTATVALAVWKGASIVRVHDVEATVRTVRMVEAVRGAKS
jgi:dihydropteroate synthase